MELQINKNKPTILHIDLNSCFAMIEQQANPLLRGKPVAVAAYMSPNGCILAPSVEAKKLGIKVGMSVREGRLLCKKLHILTPDTDKYRDVHLKFRTIFKNYTPLVSPKSIDEAILEFPGVERFKIDLTGIARDIKKQMKNKIGEWITASIGIGPNRFLAKLAASLKKPDGLEIINHKNLKTVYAKVSLTDLDGINTRYEARLNTYNIFTPLQFLGSSEQTLSKGVFKSILGYYWYLRLRGWEIDAVDFARKSFGQDYALKIPTSNKKEISKLLMKLCEKMGRRLRRTGKAAGGIHVACIYRDGTHWHMGRMAENKLYSTYDLYKKAQWLLNMQPNLKKIAKLSVSGYALTNSPHSQPSLFDEYEKSKNLTKALDKVNDKFGEFTITPALMLGMDKLILDRIAFGGVKEIRDLYDRNKNLV